MGKETKIGLGIIVLLLVVLAAVLVRRLNGPSAPPKATIAGDSKALSSTKTAANTVVEEEQPTLLQPSTENDLPAYRQTKSSTGQRWQSSSDDSQTDAVTSRRFMPDDPSTDRSPPADSGRTYSSGGRYRDSGSSSRQAAKPVASDRSTEPFNPYSSEPNVDALEEPPRPLLPSGGATSPAVQDRQTGSRRYNSAQFVPADDAESRYSQHPSQEAAYRQQSQAQQQLTLPELPEQTHRQARQATQQFQQSTVTPAVTPVVEPTSAPTPTTNRFASQPSYRPKQPLRKNTGTYYVEPGDNYWKISEKLYGTGSYFKALRELNRMTIPVPSQLNVGDKLETPPAQVLHQKYASLCPKPRTKKPGTPLVSTVSQPTPGGRTYLVEEGDTLFDIAKFELGDGSRWPEIFQLNRRALGDDIDYLQPGTRLRLPGGPSTTPPVARDQITRQPSNVLRR